MRDILKSVTNALRLIKLLSQHENIRVTDASKLLNVGTSTAHRLLATLVHEQFAEYDRESSGYRLGSAISEIALKTLTNPSDIEIREAAQPHMTRLAAQLTETVHLLVLEGNRARFIDGVESQHLIRVTLRTGTSLPAYSTSGGKVLLADLDPEIVEGMFPDGLKSLTTKSLTERSELLSELELIRSRGYALNRGESDPALLAIAVPIRNREDRAIAALALSAPVTRTNVSQMRKYYQPLNTTALEISNELKRTGHYS